MKKRTRIFALCLSFLLVLLFLLPVSASRVWKCEPEEGTLTDGRTVYYEVVLPFGYELRPTVTYVYENGIRFELPQIYSYAMDGGLVWSSNDVFFASAEATPALQAFFEDKTVGECRLGKNQLTSAPLGDLWLASFAAGLLTEGSATDTSVTLLRGNLFSSLYYYDETGTVAYRVFDFYQLENDLYAVNYETLDNTHFDANGNFSYRSGTVTLYKVPADLADGIRNAELEQNYYTYERVTDDAIDSFEGGAVVFFWVMLVLLGFLLPAAPLAIGLILPHTKKFRGEKRWYLLSLASLVWMLLTVVFILILVA